MVQKVHVFVYGTLLSGMRRSHLLRESAFIGPALIGGILYDTGRDYPALLEGEGSVIGELYEVDQETLERLDDIEGYDPARPEDSLYIRRRSEVRDFSGNLHEAYVYFYNIVDDTRVRLTPIPHGDFRRHILERGSR